MIRFSKSLTERTVNWRLARLFSSAMAVASASALLPLSVYAQMTLPAPVAAPAQDQDAPVNVSAEQMTGRPDRQVNLDRDVEVVKGPTTIKSDKAEYRIIQDEVEATGHVWMRRLQDQYTGDHAEMNMGTGAGYVSSPTYLIGKNGGRGKAERIDFISDDQALVTQGTYSTCEAPDPDWYLRANTMDLDSGRDVGTVRGGLLYFKDVPILAAPWMSFALSGERKSGVLPPTIGATSTGGFELAVPYYFNLAPNYDLTLVPKYIARRGLQMGAETRYMGESYNGVFNAEGIQDRVTGTGRYSLSSRHSQILAPGLQLDWNLNKASDNDYASDFSHSITGSTTRLLPRTASLTYSSTYWTLVGQVSKYQLLQDVNAPIVKPYDRVPQITFNGTRYDIGGFDFNTVADFTRFSSGALVGGDRAYLTQSVSYPIVRPGYFITPKVTLDATSYKLNNLAPGQQTNLTRTVPTLSLDSGLIFERESDLLGRSMTQTLEPRLFYVRTPYRDQTKLPIFDSGLADFNFAQIFSENRFVGHDRISDANQLTAAVTSRLIEENGLERLRATVGQRYYFADPKVDLTSTSTTATTTTSSGSLGSKSDLLLALGGQITREFSTDNTVQYSETLRQMVRSNFGIRWQPAPKRVLNLQYRLDRTYVNPYTGVLDPLKQVDVSGQWPLSQRIYAVGRINYSIPDRTVAEGLLGLEYKADCWVFRVVAQRIPTSSTKASTGFFFQLELNGFSQIGSNPMDAIKSSVPGYQKVNLPDSTPGNNF
ncbi:LPS-assembly protein LptD [Herbaspirillum seropedicae]|uniref:LPS-assembly protein LptD n=1 Tax=Herbaspirillum seropedicae (strain SmR1) TaxID=757424 RepID=D8IZA4_HERSS|nr:LPS-assembly protein LptD [Herbaspirillum seropedicae]ADJ62224.1 organic solvent tolerance transmembrane protein [Herbaspirillum seropedicae SmR1]AKN64387.1 OstA organic solvent tolerance protein [Herbaspirillum seropedicae]NQE27742.1 OstA organic solvent tolerance protein [Herbaspirillum seropedicae]UMU20306.1 LPS-assembly protein LptD [Herbaspirillum seropedicae]